MNSEHEIFYKPCMYLDAYKTLKRPHYNYWKNNGKKKQGTSR